MSTAAIPVHVAIIDDTGRIDPAELAGVAGALSEQVLHDFSRDWQLTASVGAYPVGAIPAGTWAVHIQEKLDQPGALGYHTDDTLQPVAYVEHTADYAKTVSHELLEMLADPWGNRMHSAELPVGTAPSDFGLSPTDRVQYLLEVCDPCEAQGYPVGGFSLSDYLLPRWYRTAPGRNRWFSHVGYCTHPREVADGGYVSFSRADGEWFQIFNYGGQLQVSDLGRFGSSGHRSLREWCDAKAREHRARKEKKP